MGFFSDIFSPVVDLVSSAGEGAGSVLQAVGQVTDADKWIGELPGGRKAQRFFYNISGAPIYERLGQSTGLLGDSSLFSYQNTNQLANALGKAYLGYVAGGGDPTLGSGEAAAGAGTTTAGPTGAGSGGEMTFTVDQSLAPTSGATVETANTGAAFTGGELSNTGLEPFTTQASLAPASSVATSPYAISPEEWDYLYGGGQSPYIGQSGLNPALSKYAEQQYAQKFGDAALDRIKKEVVTRGLDMVTKKFLPGLLGWGYQNFTPQSAASINTNYQYNPATQAATNTPPQDSSGLMSNVKFGTDTQFDPRSASEYTKDYSLVDINQQQEEERKRAAYLASLTQYLA